MITVNGEARDESDVSVLTLLECLIRDRRGIAVAVNGEIVRRADWSTWIVADGAKVEIVTAAAGG